MNQKTELNSVRGGIRMKRLAAVLTLCVFLLCCILPAAVAEQSMKAGDYTYILQPDGTAEIILYEGSETSLVIPQKRRNSWILWLYGSGLRPK